MIHWEEGENGHCSHVWLRYVEYSHWGLILTNVLPRWITPHSWEAGIAQIRVT